MSQQEHKEQVPAQNLQSEPAPPQTDQVPQQDCAVPAEQPIQPQVQELPKPTEEVAPEPQLQKKEQKPQQEPPKQETLQVPPSSQEKMSVSVQGQNGGENEGKSEKEDEDDDPGKSQRKGSSDQIQQSREEQNENDTSQPATTGGKKCFNKLCTSKKIYKKIRSKVQVARYRFLCKNCYENYVNNNFCEYCQQIYSNFDDDEDQDKWVGCDQCQRWNHVECERKFRNPNYVFNREAVDEPYECLNCSKKNRNLDVEVPKKKVQQNRQIEPPRPRVPPKIQISKEQKVSIFHKKPEAFPCLQPFLQSFNFRLWLNESLIREDIQTLRSLARRPFNEEQGKKGTKKVKLDS